MKEANKIKFDCNGNNAPAYSCDKPGDNSGTYVQYTDYDELLRERNELAAHVERLREESRRAEAFIESHVADPDITDEMTKAYCEYMAVRGSHKETPAQSLEAVKREWLVESFSKIEANMNYIAAEANEESNVMLQSSALFAAEVMRRHIGRLKP